jgi:5'-nucleotidase
MSDNRRNLVVLHTNDIHSYFMQMPKIATVLNGLKGSKPSDSVLIVDCGDHMDRMSIETEASQGRANVDVLRACGYEAVVLGNNEGLTYPKEVIASTYTGAPFEVIGSNLRDSLTGELPAWMRKYYLLEKNGLRIGLIGVTAYYPEFYELIGWQVLEPLSVTAELVQELRPKTDILIVMSHLGFPLDQRMAETIDGIDLILGGHTHHLLEQPLVVNGTAICAAGKHGQYVGEVALDYDLDERKIVTLSGRCVPVAAFLDSEPLSQLIAEHTRQGHERLSIEVARLSEPLGNEWNRESPLGNLLASGLRRWAEADIGVVNAGQILEPLEAGGVTLERLLAICPHPINPCRMKLRGEQIWKALEESLLEDFYRLPIRGFGFRGQLLGALCLDGAEITYDPEGPSYGKIVSVSLNGELMRKDQQYTVGTIDMFTFGIGYLSIREGTDKKFYMPEFIRDVLAEQLQLPEELIRCKQKRWTRRA